MIIKPVTSLVAAIVSITAGAGCVSNALAGSNASAATSPRPMEEPAGGRFVVPKAWASGSTFAYWFPDMTPANWLDGHRPVDGSRHKVYVPLYFWWNPGARLPREGGPTPREAYQKTVDFAGPPTIEPVEGSNLMRVEYSTQDSLSRHPGFKFATDDTVTYIARDGAPFDAFLHCTKLQCEGDVLVRRLNLQYSLVSSDPHDISKVIETTNDLFAAWYVPGRNPLEAVH
jgi:hypothetical protein